MAFEVYKSGGDRVDSRGEMAKKSASFASVVTNVVVDITLKRKTMERTTYLCSSLSCSTSPIFEAMACRVSL